MATWENRNAMEAILSYVVYLLNVTVRASTCTVMEWNLFSQKLANLTQGKFETASLNNEGRGWFMV